MGKGQFLLETANHCFLCLTTDKTPKSSKTLSLHSICKYLKLSLKEVLSQATSVSASTSSLEEYELKGTLCEECAQRYATFSKHLLELDQIKMKVESSLRSIHDKMLEVSGSLEGFKKEMLRRPKTLVQYEIVEKLRRKTLEECSRKLSSTSPRVILSKLSDSSDSPAIPPKKVGKTRADKSSPDMAAPTATKITSDEENEDDDLFEDRTVTEARQAMRIVHTKPPTEREKLDKPLSTFNSVTGNHTCCICSKTFRNGRNFRLHYNNVHLKLKYECTACGKQFNYQITCVKHHQTVHNGVRYKCPTCKQTFSQRENLERHKRNKSCGIIGPRPVDKTPEPSPSNCCHICKKVFTRVETLRNHVQAVHLKLREFKCDYCKKTFKYVSELPKHIRKFHPEEEYEKEKTRSKLKSTSEASEPELERIENENEVKKQPLEPEEGSSPPPEMEIDIGPIKLETPSLNLVPLEDMDMDGSASEDNDDDDDESGESSEDEEDKKGREVPPPELNPKTGKYKCGRCSTELVSKGNYKMHYQNVHLKVGYKCKLCDKTFNFPSGYNAHRMTVHMGVRFKCKPCKKEFTQKSTLNLHRRMVHSGPLKMFQCKRCPKEFSRPINLKLHMEMHERKDNQPVEVVVDHTEKL